MNKKIEINAASFTAITTIAKKLSGNIMLEESCFAAAAEGVWVIKKTHTPSLKNCCISLAASGINLTNVKKIKNGLTVESDDEGYIISGSDSKGGAVTEHVPTAEYETVPENTDTTMLGEISSAEAAKLFSMKMTSPLPLYLLFSKNSAAAVLMNEYCAGISRASGKFSSAARSSLSKAVAQKMSTVLQALKFPLTFEVSYFKCWDSGYLQFAAEADGLTIICETAGKYVPSLPKEMVPPQPQLIMSSEGLTALFPAKPALTDVVEYSHDGLGFKVMASSVSHMFKCLDKTNSIAISSSEKYTYFSDNNGHIFVVGSAK